MLIYIAEDHKDIVTIQKKYLSEHTCIELSDIKDGVDLIKNFPPHILITSMHFSTCSTGDAFLKFRAAKSDLPIIISSGLMEGDIIDFLTEHNRTENVYILEKPYSEKDLCSLVKRIQEATTQTLERHRYV